MSVPFRHMEVTEVLWKAKVVQDSTGKEIVTWEKWWLVFDADASEEYGWFALVRYVWRDGAKRLTCSCPDRHEESSVWCAHEKAVTDATTYKGDGRPQAPVNGSAMVE